MAAPSPPTRHRGRRRALIVVVGIGVVLLLVGLWLTFGGERAQQSSELEARQRLGAAGTATVTTAAGAPPLTGAPAPGLYRYQGGGHENTSFPPMTEDQGPSMPATVTIEADGCWVLRIDFNTHHWESWTYCTRDGELTEPKGASFARRSFGGMDFDNVSEFRCDPTAVILRASDAPGVSRPRSCGGTGSLIPATTTATGTMTVVGTESIDVGGDAVTSAHLRYDLTYAGGQSGTEKSDFWFATSTGMLVRNEHHILVNTDSPFGEISYTEDAQFTLQTAGPV